MKDVDNNIWRDVLRDVKSSIVGSIWDNIWANIHIDVWNNVSDNIRPNVAFNSIRLNPGRFNMKEFWYNIAWKISTIKSGTILVIVSGIISGVIYYMM